MGEFRTILSQNTRISPRFPFYYLPLLQTQGLLQDTKATGRRRKCFIQLAFIARPRHMTYERGFIRHQHFTRESERSLKEMGKMVNEEHLRKKRSTWGQYTCWLSASILLKFSRFFLRSFSHPSSFSLFLTLYASLSFSFSTFCILYLDISRRYEFFVNSIDTNFNSMHHSFEKF